jgi:hypothetical protein
MMEELCFDTYETGLNRCNTEKDDDHNEVSFLLAAGLYGVKPHDDRRITKWKGCQRKPSRPE